VLFGCIPFFSLFVANKSKSSFWQFNTVKNQNKIQENPNITWRTKLKEANVCGREKVIFKVYSMRHMRWSFSNL